METLNITDPIAAFNAAIHDGRLSTNPKAVNYAGKYMYMFTDRYGKNQFKNINTRRYLP